MRIDVFLKRYFRSVDSVSCIFSKKDNKSIVYIHLSLSVSRNFSFQFQVSTIIRPLLYTYLIILLILAKVGDEDSYPVCRLYYSFLGQSIENIPILFA